MIQTRGLKMMIAARFASLALAYALLAGLSYGAVAQVAAPPQGSGDAGTPNPAAPQFSVNTRVGDWAVRCSLTTVKSPAPCDVIQQVLNDDTKARVMSFSLAYLPSSDNYIMQVIVPTGVALRRGLIVAAGTVALQGVKFSRCEPDGCYVEAIIDAAAVNALFADGASTRVTAIGYGQTNEINLPLSLEGFSVALGEMRKQARDRAIPIPADQPVPQPLTVTAYAPAGE
jgi:invasion protein IalB